MATAFIGQIIQGGWNFAPRGYAFCAGQTLAINSNSALFSLLGTTFGGNGVTTFQLPNLQSRSMMGVGQGASLTYVQLGEAGGVEDVTLNSTQIPAHIHAATFDGSTSTLKPTNVKATTQIAAAGSMLGKSTDSAGVGAIPLIYSPSGSAAGAALGGLNVAGTVTVSPNSGGQPHTNRSPYLGIMHVIALQGVFPSRN
jgi:microcystin-dependent protein